MTTVIDSLILELGIDPKKFTKGQQEAMSHLRRFQDDAKRVGGDIEIWGQRVVDLLASFRREALGAAALFLGGRGLIDFFTGTQRADLAVGNLSRRIALNAQELGTWQTAMKASGGTAEGASAALAGLSSEMTRFTLTGRSDMLGILGRLGVSLFDQNRNLKTSAQLWIDLADAVEGMDPRQAASFLEMIPGANADMINFALLGGRAMRQYLNTARESVGTLDKSIELAREYTKAATEMDAASTRLGRTLTVLVGPAVNTVLNSLADLLKVWATSPDSPEGKEISEGSHDRLVKRFGSPRAFVKGWFGWLFSDKDLDEMYGPEGEEERNAGKRLLALKMRKQAEKAKLGPPVGGHAAAGGYGNVSISDVEDMIRREAAARGINPEVALRVAKSEGLYNYKSTVPGEESYGPYQLYFGDRGGGGLGPEFVSRYGIDPRSDRSRASIRAQVQFSLDKAVEGGWGPWHGWQGLPRAGLPAFPQAAFGGGIGAAGSGTTNNITTHVGEINVNAPNARDAKGIADEIVPYLRRGMLVGHSETGGK